MSKMNFSSGPWNAELALDEWVIRQEPGGVSFVSTRNSHIFGDETSRANASLISAAPEMLMCCEAALVYLLLEPHMEKEQLIDELRKVINKAKGGVNESYNNG